jgi:hypothetical protein
MPKAVLYTVGEYCKDSQFHVLPHNDRGFSLWNEFEFIANSTIP